MIISQVSYRTNGPLVHSSMTGNFNPKLSRSFEPIMYSDLNGRNRILHVFSLTKLLPVSILATLFQTSLTEADYQYSVHIFFITN